MTFEKKSLRVIVLLDPAEGVCDTNIVGDYVESDNEMDQIYKITKQD